RHVPFRILPDPHRLAVAADTTRRGLEEQLRARRLVNPIVEVAAAGRPPLLHPRRAAAVVRHARGPDILRRDRRHHPRQTWRPAPPSKTRQYSKYAVWHAL